LYHVTWNRKNTFPAALNPLNVIAVVYSNTNTLLLDLNFIGFADCKMVLPPQITGSPAEKKSRYARITAKPISSSKKEEILNYINSLIISRYCKMV